MIDEQLPEHEEPSLEHLGPVLFQDVLDRFVHPEASRRQQTGEWSEDTVLHCFQILFHPEREPEVRFNSQVGGTLQFVAARALQEGEDVGVEDIAGVKGYEPLAADAGVPHLTAFAHRDGWALAFDFRYRHPRRFDYLSSGREFAATSREAFAANRLGVALDNAFSAVELLAKAELLSCQPTIDAALASHSHGGVATPYSLWARLDNTDPRFVRLLHRLQELRPAGRYLNKELALKTGEDNELFELLAEMEEHVGRVVDGEDSGQGPHGFNVIATRDLKAGELVMERDVALKPLRGGKKESSAGDA